MVFQKGNKNWLLRKKAGHHSKQWKKGYIPWNKGKSQPKSPEHIALLRSGIFKGKNNPFYGKRHSEEQKNRWSQARMGYTPSIQTREKISKNTSGKGNPNYIDGRSFEPYPSEFKKIRKSKIILKRDKFICQLCKEYIPKFEGQHKNYLTIHHIDYNKKNNSLNNLITLCNFCNVSVNTSRAEWQKFFEGGKNA